MDSVELPEPLEERVARLELQTQAYQRKSRRAGYAAILAIIMSLAICVNSIVYANSVGEKSDRRADQQVAKFCDVLRTLDMAYNSVPPSTATGRKIADEMHNLRVDLGC